MAETSTDRLVRMLGLVAYLDKNPSVPVPELARHFGVSERQVVQDVELLWVSGTPGYAPDDLIDFDYDQFERGYITITADRGMRRPLRLATREAIVLLSALEAVREVAGSGISPAAAEVLDRAMAKLRAATGAAVDALEVELPVEGVSAVREAVGRALAEGRRLRIRYVDAADVATEREVDPARVFTDQGVTYLQGWCHRAQGERTFRLDRVLEAEVLDLAVEHPAGGEPEPFRPDADDALVTLVLEPGARWLVEQVPVESVAEEEDGALRVALRVGEPAWLRALLLREAPNVRRVEPGTAAEPAVLAARAALDAYAAIDRVGE